MNKQNGRAGKPALRSLSNPDDTECTLICGNGSQLVVPIRKPANDFTYAGRLWAFNQVYSEQLGKPVFCEINENVTADMRVKATQVLAMADRYEAQLRDMAAKNIKQ